MNDLDTKKVVAQTGFPRVDRKMYYQNTFLSSDPYSKSVNTNWLQLKLALSSSILKHVPQQTMKVL